MPDTLPDDLFGLEDPDAASVFYVVSVSGLTANATYGQTAQIGTPLYASAHHFSGPAPSSVAWQWRDGAGDIPGASGAAYTPAVGNNLNTIYPVATPLDAYAPRQGPAHTVRFAPPVVVGPLPDISYAEETGAQTVDAASAFTGDTLAYSVSTQLPGVSIASDTGLVTIETGNGTRSGTVAVTATNSGGSVQSQFNLEITGADFTVTLSGLTGGSAQIGTTVSASVSWLSPEGTVTGYQWTRDGVAIPGATGPTYLVSPAEDGTVLSCTVSTAEYGPQASLGHEARYAAPVAVGSLADQVYATGSGPRSVNAAAGFAGAGLAYAIATTITGVTIDSATGAVTIPTGSSASGTVTVAATNSGGSAQVSFSVTIAGAVEAPSNTIAPVISPSGPQVEGTLLSVSDGTWTGTAPISLSYQWKRNGSSIPGATTKTYTIQAADAGKTLYCFITGTNSAGTARAKTLLGVEVVAAAAPVNTAPPSIAGNPSVPATLTATAGSWTGSPAPSVTGQWLRGGSPIGGATGATYDTAAGDEGATISYREIATNSEGSGTATSNGIAVSAAATVPAQMAAPVITATGTATISVDRAAAPADGGSPITSYDLRWQPNGGAWMTVTGITDPQSVTGLTAATLYNVQTRAVNAVGAGLWSASGSATTNAAKPIDILSNATGTVDIVVDDGTFSVTVSGSDYAHQNGTFGPFDTADLDSGPVQAVPPVISGAGIVGQTLTAAPGLWVHAAGDVPMVGGAWISGGTGTGDTGATYLVAPGDAGNEVLYRETATNRAGARVSDSNNIAISTAATAPAQMAPPAITATSATAISVDRAAAPADGGSAILSYDLRWQPNGGSWTTVTGITDPQAVTGLTASTLYNVQTRAVNAVGAGAWSASGSATTDAAGEVIFSDDFGSTYHTLGNALTASGVYTSNGGGGLPINSKDSGGTRVAAQDANIANWQRLLYTDATVADARKVSLTVRTLRNGAAGKSFRFYPAYTDDNNLVDVNLDTGGYLTITHKTGGVNNIATSIPPPAVMIPGDTLSVELNGASMSIKVNGSHVGSSPYTIPATTGYGAPGFYQIGTSTTTTPTEFTLFEVEEL